jgi:hypothetical protein
LRSKSNTKNDFLIFDYLYKREGFSQLFSLCGHKFVLGLIHLLNDNEQKNYNDRRNQCLKNPDEYVMLSLYKKENFQFKHILYQTKAKTETRIRSRDKKYRTTEMPEVKILLPLPLIASILILTVLCTITANQVLI